MFHIEDVFARTHTRVNHKLYTYKPNHLFETVRFLSFGHVDGDDEY